MTKFLITPSLLSSYAADRCNRLEKERDNALLKAEESVSKDLFLQAISAATGKILK